MILGIQIPWIFQSKDVIGEMLGHSNSIVTEHYLGSLDLEKTFEANESLY